MYSVKIKFHVGYIFYTYICDKNGVSNARGHAAIKLLFCGATLGDGTEFGIGVKIVSFTLGRAAISSIALVSSFVVLFLWCCRQLRGSNPWSWSWGCSLHSHFLGVVSSFFLPSCICCLRLRQQKNFQSDLYTLFILACRL